MLFVVLLYLFTLSGQSKAAWTTIRVKNIIRLGATYSPTVPNVNRDGGHSVLVGGKVIWLFDDTERRDTDGQLVSFVSNSAAYSTDPTRNLTLFEDFGVKQPWVAFSSEELAYMKGLKNDRRLAIWPGTNLTPVGTDRALLFAPIVFVDPTNSAHVYQSRGATLISVKATKSSPEASRLGPDTVVPYPNIEYGVFTALAGRGQLYLLGMDSNGLQLARVPLIDATIWSSYEFFNTRVRSFSPNAPARGATSAEDTYLAGKFSSGTIFYSPYFATFVLIYFTLAANSTFYIRFLDLDRPTTGSNEWRKGGRFGKGIHPEDIEALVRYTWSAEQVLYRSPAKHGTFNYAGQAHPEYFNRQYYAEGASPWLGGSVVPERNTPDGKHLLLSWTSQDGMYRTELAIVEFEDLPTRSGLPPASSTTSSATTAGTGTAVAPKETKKSSATVVIVQPLRVALCMFFVALIVTVKLS